MNLNALTAISPIDGRYRRQLGSLAPYFSEYGLIRYRVLVEIKYFEALAAQGIFEMPAHLTKAMLTDLHKNFSEKDAAEIKKIETTTNHDVKAVEYWLKEKLEALEAGTITEWIHFGLTSQDINNTAIPMLWRDVLIGEYLPLLIRLGDKLEQLSISWHGIPMLARTHGQPASPTFLGKELMVFVERLKHMKELLTALPFAAKFGGATGNFNAHHVAFPETDWQAFANHFLAETLGLFRSRFTTQIEHYDYLAAQFDALKRINTILIDLCRDLWTYISMEYFRQKTKAGEVGSSAMPHKVNPIDFENAEGNLGIANALFEHLSAKLPISRLQRDLTDSTVLRNIGVPLSHSFLAMLSIGKGLDKLVLNEARLHEDLEQNYAVVAEAIQTVLRREGYPKPYEALKELTRGNSTITRSSIDAFIATLDVSEDVKQQLLSITPHNYTGPKWSA